MLEKTLAAVAGLIVLAALIFVAVLAGAYALYAGLEPPLGKAGAAAIVAGLFALLAGIAIAVVALRGDRGHKDRDGDGHPDFSFVERILEMAKDRPLLSVAALVAGGVILFRNPAMVATIAAAFLDKPKGR
jgi:hypothetical protein